jgi:hypothetical protein
VHGRAIAATDSNVEPDDCVGPDDSLRSHYVWGGMGSIESENERESSVLLIRVVPRGIPESVCCQITVDILKNGI